jgi:hypothetical protein
MFQVDIPNVFRYFLEEQLPEWLKETEKVMVASNKMAPPTGTKSFDCLSVC